MVMGNNTMQEVIGEKMKGASIGRLEDDVKKTKKLEITEENDDESKRKKKKRKKDHIEDLDQDKRNKKKKKKKKKEKKEKKKNISNDEGNSSNPPVPNTAIDSQQKQTAGCAESSSLAYKKEGYVDDYMVMSSALDHVKDPSLVDHSDTTLLLFYQYIEPPWKSDYYHQTILPHFQSVLPDKFHLGGRLRVAREGLNGTLSGTHANITSFCQHLRTEFGQDFSKTEFKLTTDLPRNQHFGNVKVIPVQELVNYGLAGQRAPSITSYGGTHLDPQQYHAKLTEENTVLIDVRNHYEAAIGHFAPSADSATDNQKETDTKISPTTVAATTTTTTAEYIDPKMRKSTEFPIWLDKPETKQMLKGKQVLMYCTGGIRCERASALLRYKMQHDEEMSNLGITGVYQLQGGIDKYLKEFPNGGHWKGKNYTFDKRFAHGAAAGVTTSKEEQTNGDKDDQQLKQNDANNASSTESPSTTIMGRCESCHKPWDMYRGKRRCPTCGVPSLICRDCFQNQNQRELRQVQCDLCVEQGIRSKAQLRKLEEQEESQYEAKLKGLHHQEADTDNGGNGSASSTKQYKNHNKNNANDKHNNKQKRQQENRPPSTRIFCRNMCKQNMTTEILQETLLPSCMTHVVWRHDRRTGDFTGQGWIEMASLEDAKRVVDSSGKLHALGRPLFCNYDAPNAKDTWPPPNSAV